MRILPAVLDPTDRQLRQFAVLASVALPCAVSFVTHDVGRLGAAAGVGALLAVIGWFRPRAVRPLFIGLSLITLPMGIVVGELALSAVFFGVVTPLGLLMRLVRRDRLDRRFDPAAATYWRPKRPPQGPQSYFRQS